MAHEDNTEPPTVIYPDTGDGFLAMLNADSALTITREDCEAIKPDPQVDGVWYLKLKTPQDGVCEIIGYLAGYKNPWGEVRAHNDFECGYEDNEDE